MRKTLIILILFISNFANAQLREKASFSLQVEDIVIPYSVFGVFVLPNEERAIEILFENQLQNYYLISEAGVLNKDDETHWRWRAPKTKGVYQVTAYNQSKQDSVKINFFVMVPYENLSNGKLNGYKIGSYPLSKNANYPLPKGFIELTKANFDVKVSPHFSIGEFMCKQAGNFPKYLVLKEKLLLKLELVIDELQQEGVEVENMTVMSGYRTPFYNKAIGNVKYSRHVFGDAADVFIDNNSDFKMDDINKDGYSNKKDARVMYKIIDDMKDQTWYKNFIGGLGLYGANSSHPAFVHVDGRGFLARWGI